ncbi:MAG TPA: hypothetical protein HPQ00_03715 [Magnetococcales bacterium]|nr:hypothetical protein [Magnetococcales bacterium]
MNVKKSYGKIMVLAGIVGFIPMVADAYCLINKTNVIIHGQSLDSSAFEADIAPGESVCCDDCLYSGQSTASLLVVTGYVPVSQNSQPGWNAECRIHVSALGQAVVTGSASRINCKDGNPQ